MDTELTRSRIEDNKLYLGELEFTNLIKRLSRAYRYRRNNENPEAIVIPNIKEVDGIRIEILDELTLETLKKAKETLEMAVTGVGVETEVEVAETLEEIIARSEDEMADKQLEVDTEPGAGEDIGTSEQGTGETSSPDS